MEGYEGDQLVEADVAHSCSGGRSRVDRPSFSVLVECREEFLVGLGQFGRRWGVDERHVEKGFGVCHAGFVWDGRGAEGGGYEGADGEEGGYVEVLVGLGGGG